MVDRGCDPFLKRFAQGVSVSSVIAVVAAALWSGSASPGRGVGLTADLFSLLQARSPGERAAGALAQSKPRRAAPFERVLSNSRTRPAAVPARVAPATAPAILLAEVPLVAPVEAPVAGVPVETLGGVPLGVAQTAPVFFGGGAGAGTPVTSGPGGGVPGAPGTPDTGTQPVVTVPEVSGAVPEPKTWGMMLIGFGMIGWSLRRERVFRLPRPQP